MERSTMCRLAGSLFLAAAGAMALVPSGPARAQIYGTHSGAVDLATVDASALGDTLRSSLGFFAADQWVIAGGVGVLGGSAKGYLGSDPNRLGFPYAIGVGYARTDRGTRSRRPAARRDRYRTRDGIPTRSLSSARRRRPALDGSGWRESR